MGERTDAAKLAEYKEICLVHKAESSAEYRSERAAQYPDDNRNEKSAQALTKLSEALLDIPPDDPLLRQCYEAEMIGFSGPDVFDSCRLIERFEAEKNDLFGRYGFDAPEDGNPYRFLEEYLQMIRDCLAQMLDEEAEASED